MATTTLPGRTAAGQRRATLTALLLVALNLRIAVAAISPVLPEVRATLGLSRGAAGLLTTLPVVCFGLLAPVAAYAGRRLGSEVAVLVALVALTVGIGVRSAGAVPAVVAGTALLGAGIAFGNVLVPSLIKQDLPEIAGPAMTAYTAALTGGAAIAAAATAPLVHSAGLSWQAALAWGAAPAVLALAVWAPQLRRHHRPPGSRPGGAGGSVARAVWRSPVAWALAVFMGVQSLLFYTVLAWFPAMLQDRGVSATEAGVLLSVFNLLGILGAVSVPALAARQADQRGLAVVTAVSWLVGIGGLLLAPGLLVLWTVVLGVGQGAGIAMAMTLIVLRAAHGPAARELSGMVQTTGYLLGAGGPFVIGVLRDRTGSWTVSLVVLVVLCVVMTAAAAGAGRARVVG